MTLAAWALDPALVHLNHGSFGGCPRVVLAAADALRARLESAPMRFFVREWQPLLDAARARVADFVHADPAHLVFVASATTGVATALAALASEVTAGDELLATTHAYRACKNQLARIAEARGARVVVAPIALPFDADACTDAILAAATPRTRIAILDHVTSPTGLVFPLARLVPALATRGVHVVIDGAHGPGQVDVDVDALLAAGATYYTGNHHKWICGPKTSAFLVAAPAFVARTRPLVTSHGASREYGGANRFHAEHDWTGTHDPTAHLAVPAALDAIAALGGGWPAVRARNHALAVAMRDRLTDALGVTTPPLAPADCIGSMAAIPIALPPNTAPLELQGRLLDAQIEAPIVNFPSGPLLRVSAHLYNTLADLDPLIAALAQLGVRGL